MAKTTKASKSTDVIELEAVEELPLEKQIENQLVKNNVTEAVIAGLKEKFGGLQLKDLEDKETYLEIKDARKEVRQYGILAEKICKVGREDAIKIQKLWLSKEKEVLGKIAEVQDPLDAEIKKFDDEVERKELAEAQRREEAYIKRQSQLLKMGATYDNGSFVLNHISYEMNLVKESDEDIWTETILPKYHREYEKNESVRVAEERRREEASEALRQQQLEMDRQKKEFEEQQRVFREQQETAAKADRDRQAKLRSEEDEKEREKRLTEQKAEDERREKNRQRLEARANQLRALGMSFNFQYDAYTFEDVNIDNKTELCLWSDKEWEDKIAEITPVIEQRKQAAEEKRLAKIEEDKRIAAEEAATKERERILEEQRQEKIKADQEAARKAEEALQANDKTKWQTFIASITGVTIPEMKSPSYRGKITEAQRLVQKILNL